MEFPEIHARPNTIEVKTRLNPEKDHRDLTVSTGDPNIGRETTDIFHPSDLYDRVKLSVRTTTHTLTVFVFSSRMGGVTNRSFHCRLIAWDTCR